MINLIRHLLRNNWEEIVSKSLLHCHTPNVHSLMLLDCPEKRIRMFYALEDHNLHTNRWSSVKEGNPMAVAFHPHHCNLSLQLWLGTMKNVVIGPGSKATLKRFRYTSEINDEGISFVEEGVDSFDKLHAFDLHIEGQWEQLNAKEIHTIFVPERERCAWFVFEGKEDPDYQPLCWAATQPSSDKTGLYVKPTEAEMRDLIFELFRTRI